MAKELKRSPEGRKCKFINCQSLLSIYNHQDYCRIHLEQMLAQSAPTNLHLGKRKQVQSV